MKAEIKVDDICLYHFDNDNESHVIVQVKRLIPNKEAAEIAVLQVIVDDSGNGFFHYLKRTGNHMNASLKHLIKLI